MIRSSYARRFNDFCDQDYNDRKMGDERSRKQFVFHESINHLRTFDRAFVVDAMELRE